ncbi:hypothetical protein [Caproiciproducens galactitolivorans]|uniref:Uncharacterized protein n=1 Tax=Caproiciproducens galactitolivorans TaxID=642589 RepID=A0ABT4BRD3_9FIRM|nr:hypothetical protein [Caproiciproducens galactitolivorans]MCY1713442.1 hypothetical protein [Caproiciproducens galactitolivorans]
MDKKKKNNHKMIRSDDQDNIPNTAGKSEDQNQEHNVKKVALGPNTKR